MYLLMKCVELDGQWESQLADRTPMGLFETIEEINELKKDYRYEIYEINGTNVELMKEYDEAEEEGIALVRYIDMDQEWDCYGEGTIFEVVKKFPNLSRKSCARSNFIDKNFIKPGYFKKEEAKDIALGIECCGSYSDDCGNNSYCLTEYRDNLFYCPY